MDTKNIPGVEQLRQFRDAIYDAETKYSNQFERMMDDENNDGICALQPIDKELREDYEWMVKNYPRAALYLKAEGYTYSNNHHKYGAGKKAMEIIANGGSLEEAESILENWLPKSSIWN